MGNNNSELLRQDLKNILYLNTKMNYNNPEEVKKTYNIILQKNLFHSPLGQRYTKRLKQVIDKTDNSKQCILCENIIDNSTLVCTQCLEKYEFVQSNNKNIRSQAENQKDIGQQISEKSKQTVSTIKGGLDILSTKISETVAENGIDIKNMPKMVNLKDIKKEDVVNMANKSKDAAKKGVKKSVSFWKSLSKKKKIAVVAALAFLLIFAFQRNTNTGQKVNNDDVTTAQKILEEVFSGSEYTIRREGQVSFPLAMFEMEINESRKYGDYGKLDKIHAYMFFVRKDLDYEFARCYVSADGRIIGYGTMICGSDQTEYYYRLK